MFDMIYHYFTPSIGCVLYIKSAPPSSLKASNDIVDRRGSKSYDCVREYWPEERHDMGEHIPKWVKTLALDIYKVIHRYKAMPRFAEMVNKLAEDHQAEIAKEIKWGMQRASHFEETVANDSRLQDEGAGPPEEGWEFQSHVQHYENNHSIIQGWVPPELAHRPEISQILPLSRDRALSLVEKYTIMAVIYECGRKGTEELPLWKWPDFNKEQTPHAMLDAKKCLSFEALSHRVTDLVPEDEEWLKTMLDDVEKDLANSWDGRSAQPQEEQQERELSDTRLARYVRWAKNHWLISILIFFSIIVIGFGTVIKNVQTIVTFFRQTPGQHGLEDKPIIDVTPIGISQNEEKMAATCFRAVNNSQFIARHIAIDVKYGDNYWISEWVKAEEDRKRKENKKEGVGSQIHFSKPKILLPELKPGEMKENLFAIGSLDLEKKVSGDEKNGFYVLVRITWENEIGRTFDEVHKYKLISTTVESGRSYTFISEGIISQKD